ncbi:hypothetical protein ACPB9E_21985 [Streptomyces exfoliatus]|uniref:hypothetical protein n=1 Tax=Streptomyces exfoliatus TaxID=1905 RepID=UPI003C2E6D1A
MDTSPRPMVPRTLHRPGQRFALFLVGASFALLGAGMLTQTVTTGFVGVLLHAVILVGGVWVAFRSCVMGVRIDSTGLAERGLGRSKVIPWCAIGEVDTGAGPGMPPAGAPGLVLRKGERVTLGAIASYSSRVVDADFSLIRSLHTAHVAECPDCA